MTTYTLKKAQHCRVWTLWREVERKNMKPFKTELAIFTRPEMARKALQRVRHLNAE